MDTLYYGPLTVFELCDSKYFNHMNYIMGHIVAAKCHMARSCAWTGLGIALTNDWRYVYVPLITLLEALHAHAW